MQPPVDTPQRPRRLRLRFIAVLAALAALASACGSERDETTTAASPGAVLDASVLTGEATTISGETVDLASLADQDLVVWFWAPW